MSSWHHQPIGQEAGAPKVAGTPFGYAWEKDKSQHVVFRGTDNQIHELWFQHGLLQWGEWKHNPIGEVTGAPPAASDPCGYSWEADKTQHVIYRGTDNMIHELWCRGGKWYHNPLGQTVGAPPAAGNPFGYAWEYDDTQHIIYRGMDNKLHEIWYRDQWLGQDWHYNGIGELVGAPLVAEDCDPMGYAWEKDKTQHVIYRAKDNMIHELWCRGGKWAHSPLGQMTGAPKAMGSPYGYAWERNKTQHILYRGVDNKIHEIWYYDQWVGQDWHYHNLSDTTDAPPAASDPVGYPWEDDKTQHILYIGQDNRVHQLWYRDEMLKRVDWHHNPIGEVTNAPRADGKLSGYAWEGDGSQHVIFCSKGQIHELWLKN